MGTFKSSYPFKPIILFLLVYVEYLQHLILESLLDPTKILEDFPVKLHLNTFQAIKILFSDLISISFQKLAG